MLGPLARSRAVLGAGVLLTAGAGSVVLASGVTSAPAPVSSSARTYGPVVTAPAARPLVDLSAPLLQGVATTPRLAPRPGVVGPRRGAAELGPPGPVGPGSPPAHVRMVQRLLNARGAGLRVDGAWGPATARAVAAAQAAEGLAVDGWVSPLTLSSLGG